MLHAPKSRCQQWNPQQQQQQQQQSLYLKRVALDSKLVALCLTMLKLLYKMDNTKRNYLHSWIQPQLAIIILNPNPKPGLKFTTYNRKILKILNFSEVETNKQVP